MHLELGELKADWLGHSAFRLKAEGKVVYIDPFQLGSGVTEKADVILITHEHYDHCSKGDIGRIAGSNTIIVTVADCQSKLAGLGFKQLVLAEPNRVYDVSGIKIAAVPAYNISKQFHPKNNSWVGFVINISGKRIYHAGDTDFIPEMK